MRIELVVVDIMKYRVCRTSYLEEYVEILNDVQQNSLYEGVFHDGY